MAVLKPVLEWSTHQQKMLDSLNRIEKSLNTIEFGQDLEDYRKINYINMKDIAKATSTAIVTGFYDILLGGNNTTLEEIISSRIIPAFQEPISNLSNVLKDNNKVVKDKLDEIVEDTKESSNSIDRTDTDLGNTLLSNILDVCKDFYSFVKSRSMEDAKAYSEYYNDIIRYTGASGKESQDFRKEFVDSIDALNREVGSAKYNAVESLNTLISISNTTSISNKKTLLEIAEPILLAQETLDLSLNELAETTARFYNRYNFATEDMEELVDYLGVITKDKDVDEGLILKYINDIESYLALDYKDSPEAMSAALDSFSASISMLESNYMESSTYVDIVKGLLSDNITEYQAAKRKIGGNADIESAVKSGNFQDASAAYAAFLADPQNKFVNLNARGFSEEEINHAILAVGDQTADAFKEAYYDSLDDTQDAIDKVSDKYISVEERIINSLSTANDYLAEIQENMGIGLSDINIALNTVGNIVSGALIGRSLMSGGGSFAAAAGIGGGITSLLTVAGPIAAAVAALGLVAASIYDAYKKVNDLNEENLANTTESLGVVESGNVANWESIYEKNEEGDGYIQKDVMTQTPKASTEMSDVLEKNKEVYDKQLAEDREKPWYEYLVSILVPGFSDVMDIDHKANIIRNEIISEKLIRITNGTDEEKKLYNAYYSEGYLLDKYKKDFFINNFDEFYKLSEEGLAATESSEEGLENPGPRKELLGYKIGANYIPEDQLAYLHKGEAVVPEEYNPSANLTELELLRREKETNNYSDNNISELVSILTEIKEFIQLWKNSSERIAMKDSQRNFVNQRMSLLNYFTQQQQ